MGTATIKSEYSFDEDDFNIEKLAAEMVKSNINVDSLLSFDNGEFQCFDNTFSVMLDSVNVSAQISFTRGCMYMRNGDPGYPDESEFEDLEVAGVLINGTSFIFQDCLTKKCLDKIEEHIWEKSTDSEE